MSAWFCPNAIVWGDLATWFTGGATFLTALVALSIARSSDARITARAAEDRRRDAAAMSVALHAELTRACGPVAILANSRNETLGLGHGAAYQELAAGGTGQLATPLLDRFADHFGRFEPLLASRLAACLAGVTALQHSFQAPTVGGQPMNELAAALVVLRIENTAASLLPLLYSALDDLRPLAESAGFPVIETWRTRALAESGLAQAPGAHE